MHPNTEKRSVLLLYFLSEMLLYAAGLRAASLCVLDTLGGVDWAGLQRDRLVCMVFFAATAAALGAYDPRRITDRFDAAYLVVAAIVLALFGQLALATLTSADARVISRRELVAGAAAAAVLLPLWRIAAAAFLWRFRSLHRRFHVLGDASEGGRIAEAINGDGALHAEAALTTLDALRERCGHRQGRDHAYGRIPEDVIIEAKARPAGGFTEMLTFCEEHFERVYLYPSFDDLLLCSHDALHAVAGIPLIDVTRVQWNRPYALIKRMVDIAAALLGLVLSLPICLLAAVLVKTTSPGPLFYTQERLGRDGKAFRIIKFRSMRDGADKKDQTGHVLAEREDDRFTPVGRFLRRHRIDEIPQLLNVLKGDMSLVGPRPVWREYYDLHASGLPLIHLRLLVRPGLTSLSHVFGSYTSDPRDRLRYDLVYINSLSLLTDLKILFATVRVVLSGKGAQ